MVAKTRSSQGNTTTFPRRQFIVASAAATSLTIVSRSLVFGTQANARIKVGCVGLGGRGAWIARHLKAHGGYEVAAVADYFPEVAERVGAELGVPTNRQFSGLKGYQRLIDSQVDAVFLETPPYCFPEHVAAAAVAGCHIYIAKPLACDVPGSLLVEKKAQQATQQKKVFLCDFQTRTDNFYREAIRRVHAGDIGELAMLEVRCGTDGFADPPKTNTIASRLQDLIWVNDEELGGGLLVNFDIHAVDVALWIAGARPVSAMGCARRGDPNANANANGNAPRAYSLTYQFESGLILAHHAEHMANLRQDGIVCNGVGSAGVIETAYGKKVQIHSNRQS